MPFTEAHFENAILELKTKILTILKPAREHGAAQLFHRAEMPEDGLRGAAQPRGERLGGQGGLSARAHKFERGGLDLFFGHLRFGRHGSPLPCVRRRADVA